MLTATFEYLASISLNYAFAYLEAHTTGNWDKFHALVKPSIRFNGRYPQ